MTIPDLLRHIEARENLDIRTFSTRRKQLIEDYSHNTAVLLRKLEQSLDAWLLDVLRPIEPDMFGSRVDCAFGLALAYDPDTNTWYIEAINNKPCRFCIHTNDLQDAILDAFACELQVNPLFLRRLA